MKAVLILVLILFGACERKQEKSTAESVFEAERANFFSSLNNPDELAKHVPGLTTFEASILNAPENSYLYTSNEVIAAANLGIYLSDLNYCVLFQQKEATKKYFQATYELSKAIRIEQGILAFLLIRYEKNLEQNDSVKAVVQQLFEQSTSGLKGTDRERLAGIAMMGYQIETLHLALSVLKSYPSTLTAEQAESKDLILNFIIDQRSPVGVIYNFVRINSDPLDPDRNPNYPFFDHTLRELMGVYDTMTKENPQLDELRTKVDAIRNKIVSAG